MKIILLNLDFFILLFFIQKIYLVINQKKS